MATLRAGKLRHYVTFNRLVRTPDGHGGFTPSMDPYLTAGAMIEGLDGRESMLAESFQGIAHYRITIRARSGLLTSDQAALPDGTVLNIRSVIDPDGRGR